MTQNVYYQDATRVVHAILQRPKLPRKIP